MDIKDMVNTLEGYGARKTNPLIYESALYYFGSIVLNMYNYRKNYNGNDKYIKYYGMVLAGSGSGKSFAIKTVESLFDKLQFYRNNMRFVYVNHYNGSAENDIYKYMPAATSSLEGTKEGLFKVAQSQAMSGYGSLNLISEEIGDTASGSIELMHKLKELYDGKYRAKIIKGSKDDDPEVDIDHIVANVLMMGSDDGVGTETRNKLESLAKSGLYRRSFIFDIKPEDVVRNKQVGNLDKLKEYFDALCENHAEVYKNNIYNDNIMEIETSALQELESINDFLIDQYNSDKYNKQYSADLGSLTAIENLSYIIAFLEFRTTVYYEDVVRAFEFYKKSRASTLDTFSPAKPYKIMYQLLKRGNPLSITEMMELDSLIPQGKNQLADNVALLDERCYRNSEQLIISEGKVVRYAIEPLPITDNNKIKISIDADFKKEKSIDFKPMEVPFFGEQGSVERLVQSDKVDSFTTAWFKESNKAPHGHRGKEYFISGQNLIAFDVDEGMNLQEAMELCKQYTYIIYTTKSHRIEKNNEVCDRFRIVMPTKNEFFVNVEQHKKMYENLSELIGLKTYDVATRNVSRLWFTNPNAEIYKNVAENIDVTSCIPDTNKELAIMPKIVEVNRAMSDGKIESRIAGMYKWFISNTSSGSRNMNLYRVAKFILELGEDVHYHINYLNQMLSEPLSDHEIQQIVRSSNS
jgi:hypothetical protein